MGVPHINESIYFESVYISNIDLKNRLGKSKSSPFNSWSCFKIFLFLFMGDTWLLNPARRVDLVAGPVRFNKKPAGATTRQNPVDPWLGRTRKTPGFFFFKCGIWNPLVYILYVPKKKIMFSQCGIKNILI